jgi:hypothetical protein
LLRPGVENCAQAWEGSSHLRCSSVQSHFFGFTVSRIKFKPLSGFQCRFRLHAPDISLYHNLQKHSIFHHSKKIDFPTSHNHLSVEHSDTDVSIESPNFQSLITQNTFQQKFQVQLGSLVHPPLIASF